MMPASRQIAASDIPVLPALTLGGPPAGGQRIELGHSGDTQHGGATFAVETGYSQWINGTGAPGNPAAVNDLGIVMGINVGAASASVRPVPGEAMMSLRMEYDYQGPAYRAMELYPELGNVAATLNYRPWIVTVRRDATTSQTMVKSFDLLGPGPTGGDATGIRFYAAKDGVNPAATGDLTYTFGRAALNMPGFADTDSVLNVQAGAGRNSSLRLGAGGVDAVVSVSTAAAGQGRISIAGAGATAYMHSINNQAGTANQAMAFGINTGGDNGAALQAWAGSSWDGQQVLRLRGRSTIAGSGRIISVEDASGTVKGGYDKSGYPFVAVNSAPADADIVAGQCFGWFDSTNGAAKMMFKGKSANGTVVAGSLPLT